VAFAAGGVTAFDDDGATRDQTQVRGFSVYTLDPPFQPTN
jgi:hypothetical protein